MRRYGVTAALMALLLLAAGCGGGGEATETGGGGETEAGGGTEAAEGDAEVAEDLGTVRIAVGAAQSIEFAAASIGQELGVWEERGLEVQNIEVSGGGEVARLMAAGEADVGLTGGPGAITPIVKGYEGQLVAATSLDFVGMVVAVAADGEIQEIPDLEGDTIGFTSHGSLTDFAARKIAESQGWELGQDIQTAAIGGIQELMAALQAGSIDAFTWSPEAAYALEDRGEARIIGDLGDIVGPNVFEAMYASNELIEERPDALTAYMEGYFEAVQWMKDNQEDAIAFMVENWELSEYAVTQSYDISIDNLSTTGEIPEENLQGVAEAVLELDDEVAETPAIEDFFTDEFVPVGG